MKFWIFLKKGILSPSSEKFEFWTKYLFIILAKIWLVWFLNLAEIGEDWRFGMNFKRFFRLIIKLEFFEKRRFSFKFREIQVLS